MKKNLRAVLFGLVTMALSFSAFAFNKTMYPYTLPAGGQGAALGCVKATAGMKLELGKWYTNFQVCKKYADDNGLPLVAIWSNHECIHCWYTDVCFIQDSFKAWQQESKAGKAIYCFMAGGDGDCDGVNTPAYNWMWYGGGTRLNAYPFVVFWWAKGGVNVRQTGDQVCNIPSNKMTDSTIPTRVEHITAAIDKAFANWSPEPEYCGGEFSDPDTEGNRLEFEAGTKSVTVNLTRNETSATNVMLVVKGPTGAVLASQLVTWTAGTTATNATIVLTDEIKRAFTTNGQQLTLNLEDGGVTYSANHITFVKREVSAANPLWIGEKFGFGEWTCDFDAATNMVKNAQDSAYTLVSIQGSMWCPDCANTDRNFLNATNAAGTNVFQMWAKSKNIALVSMDIPNYNGPTVANRMTPTLFSADAYATTLARAKEYPQSGADASLTNAIVRSGIGYMTRKGITAEKAEKQLVKFHDLAYNNTDKGGFHRPEDGNKNRTGVPIFVLLRKDGSVAARFTRFAAVSPMANDQKNFNNYIKRFEEMLAIAATTGDHADASEIANNYPGAGATAFAANGGSAAGELCNADFQDAFKLSGVGGNAAQRVVVKGKSNVEVNVQFWKGNADGTFSGVGTSVRGKLSDGVINSYTFTEAGDYYLLVKGQDITCAGFNAASETANNFHSFTVTGSTILVPQGDQVRAMAPANSDKVTIRLVKGEIYCLSGVNTTAENTAAALELKSVAGAYSFFEAKGDGDFEITLKNVGGEILYQIWEPGQVGFVATEKSVPESINDLKDDWVELAVERTGGKSGRVKARVTVDMGKTTLASERYIFETNALNAADFVWEDGVSSNQVVRIKIDDNMMYDGDAVIVLNLEVLSSDAGDVTVVDGKKVFTLTVLEDDRSAPGRGVITRTTPLATSKGDVYVRESEGAKIWVERIEAADGLVAAELVSSVPGTHYKTENVRDLTNDTATARTWVYWSSRESGEKYVQVTGIPAGTSARIQLKSYLDFETVAGANTVRIISVADDAPEFAVASANFNLYRYVASADVKVPLVANTLTGGAVSFVKLSGVLPAGLKATYDDATKSLVFTGVTTAKPGTYETVYQVVETRAGKLVQGLTTVLSFVVADPTDVKTCPEIANPAIATARTFKDLAVINPVNKRLAGVLQLTIPTRGNLSGKYVCNSGVITLTAKSWGSFDPQTRGLSALLQNPRMGIMVGVTANADGSVDVVVDDPMYPDIQLDAKTDGYQWSSKNQATGWKGYYTVALPFEGVVGETTENIAPTGSGYVTLDLRSASALKTGTVRWAGMLPNGTAVSGSAILGSPYKAYGDGGSAAHDNQTDWANLPLFKTSSTDVFAAYARVQYDAFNIRETDRRSVLSVSDVIAYWTHGERTTEVADYVVNLGLYGGIYDTTEDLGGCCREYYGENGMQLNIDVASLKNTYYGEPLAIDPLTVKVGTDSIELTPEAGNPSDVTLSFVRSTGIVTGSFNLTCGSRKIRASYKGLVVTGWGEGCGCGPTAGLKTIPFVNGSFYLTDNVATEKGKTIGVKRGAAVQIDSKK